MGAHRRLCRCHFDVCFLGVTSFHPEMGFCCESESDCVLKQMALKQSEFKVALIDSSKFDLYSTHCICAPDGVDAVVSDDGLTVEQKAFFVRQGVMVY